MSTAKNNVVSLLHIKNIWWRIIFRHPILINMITNTTKLRLRERGSMYFEYVPGWSRNANTSPWFWLGRRSIGIEEVVEKDGESLVSVGILIWSPLDWSIWVWFLIRNTKETSAFNFWESAIQIYDVVDNPNSCTYHLDYQKIQDYIRIHLAEELGYR